MWDYVSISSLCLCIQPVEFQQYRQSISTYWQPNFIWFRNVTIFLTLVKGINSHSFLLSQYLRPQSNMCRGAVHSGIGCSDENTFTSLRKNQFPDRTFDNHCRHPEKKHDRLAEKIFTLKICHLENDTITLFM